MTTEKQKENWGLHYTKFLIHGAAKQHIPKLLSALTHDRHVLSAAIAKRRDVPLLKELNKKALRKIQI